ncbi:MAG: hypothetical protein HDR31_02250 [Mycoplasma sp.]|nr:hypothetical protein [Mycoplasma sp.]
MFGFKNKKKEEVQIVDSWMRENFIPVHPTTSVRMLKPYQRMIILRKPEGEKKCIIDISLPYDEIEKLKEQVSEQRYPNVFDKNILRIIPPTSEIEERFKNISKSDMEAVAQMLNDISFNGGDIELDEMSVDKIESRNVVPVLKMFDEKVNISLREGEEKHNLSIPVDKDIDNIDGVKIKIPLEEIYNKKWNDFDEYINNINQALNEKDTNKSIDLISAMVDSTNDVVESAEKDNVIESHDNTVIETELKESNNQISADYETDYHDDYNDEVQTDRIDEKKIDKSNLSFFKKDSANYSNINATGRVYKRINFYKSDSAAEYERVVLNKKKKMIIYRRKIDKNLLK